MKPTIPRYKRTIKERITNRLAKLPHSNTDTITERIINTPPILGVPIFFLWDTGTYSLICENFSSLKNLIILGPNIKLKNNAVKRAYADLKVIYLTILKPLICCFNIWDK